VRRVGPRAVKTVFGRMITDTRLLGLSTELICYAAYVYTTLITPTVSGPGPLTNPIPLHRPAIVSPQRINCLPQGALSSPPAIWVATQHGLLQVLFFLVCMARPRTRRGHYWSNIRSPGGSGHSVEAVMIVLIERGLSVNSRDHASSSGATDSC
jgi:hypothetical protein